MTNHQEKIPLPPKLVLTR